MIHWCALFLCQLFRDQVFWMLSKSHSNRTYDFILWHTQHAIIFCYLLYCSHTRNSISFSVLFRLSYFYVCCFFFYTFVFILQMMYVLLVLMSMLIATAFSIRVDFNTNTGPIRPPTTTPPPPPPQPPFREPAPVWEDQSNDIPNPNPFR